MDPVLSWAAFAFVTMAVISLAFLVVARMSRAASREMQVSTALPQNVASTKAVLGAILFIVVSLGLMTGAVPYIAEFFLSLVPREDISSSPPSRSPEPGLQPAVAPGPAVVPEPSDDAFEDEPLASLSAPDEPVETGTIPPSWEMIGLRVVVRGRGGMIWNVRYDPDEGETEAIVFVGGNFVAIPLEHFDWILKLSDGRPDSIAATVAPAARITAIQDNVKAAVPLKPQEKRLTDQGRNADSQP